MLIDAHCHIDRFPDPSNLVQRCEAAKITTVAVTNIPSHYEAALPHLEVMRFVKLALGFHPLAVDRNRHELPLFLSLLPHAQFVGEIGLDFSSVGLASKAAQIDVFTSIIEALAGSTRFITMHSRGAADEVLDIMERFDFHHAVFHWFSGSFNSLQRAIDWGCWFSVNPSMTESANGKAIISRIPKDRLLTETDGPYVKVGKRPAEPSDVRKVVLYLAASWECSPQDAETLVNTNFIRAVGLNI